MQLALASWLVQPVPGQRVVGRLLDDSTNAPIEGADVGLLRGGSDDEFVALSLTNAEGVFTVTAQEAGRYRLRASRIGYRTVTSPPFDLSEGESLAVELRASVEAVPLAPLTVLTSRPPLRKPIRLEAGGFYERKETWGREGLGLGHFLDREHLEQIHALKTTDLLRGIPGVRVEAVGARQQVVTMRGMTMSGRCSPAIYIDGHIVRRGGDAETTIDALVAAPSVAAVEVYPGISKPGRFTDMTSNPCGAVVIWTGFR
ncbi:MAG: carboxypeptidase regulatory-like domain-containing protein [Longimicrobiales bacterium]